MRTRLVAVLIAVLCAFPVAGLADENPWTVIKGMFREPVNDIKRQFKQLRPPAKARTAPQPGSVGANPADAPEQENAPVPIPVAKPKPEVPTAVQPEIAATPQQGNSPILVEEANAIADAVETSADTPVTTPPGSLDTSQDIATPRAPSDTNTPVADTILANTSAGTVATLPIPKESEATEYAMLPSAPIPRPRPPGAMAYAATEPGSPTPQSAAAIGAVVGPLPSLVKPPPAAGSTCGVALARLGVEAKAIAPIHDGVCGVSKPVSVAALGGGVTDLTTKAILNCQVAETLAVWLKDNAQPAAQEHLAGKIVGLRVAASYACRSRNSVAGAKLSEHGRGNAIDISAFKVAGHGWVKVGGSHSLAEARFLKSLRKSACGPFKTVLGPGSDAYHSDHFHFDLAKRSKRGKSRGLYCK